MPKQLSKEKHQEVQYYLNEGLSIRETATKCGVGKSTVYEIKSKVLPNIQSKSQGRPVKLSPQNKRYCIRSITSGKCRSAKEVQKNLLNDFNISVSANTVCSTLKEAKGLWTKY